MITASITASLAGSTRIFACRSGSPSASNAPATPSSPTDPVTSGPTSTFPVAIHCSVWWNSLGS